MARHVMAVDLGSTGIKVAVVDETGRVRSSAGEVIPLVFTADGGVEQDPHLWWSALGRCARHATADAGCTAVIQPGGSIGDQKVIDAANERGLAMVFTGMRHFRH